MKTLYLITGASGSGKTTIMKSLMDNEIISFTTRNPRKNEINGRDYHFITIEQFRNYEREDKLIEKTEYSGNFYGVTKNELESKMKLDNAFFICDYHGAKQLKEIYDNCVSIFIMANKETVISNMKNRGDSIENIEKRVSTYEEETSNSVFYDFVVENKKGEIEKTKQKIFNILHHFNN